MNADTTISLSMTEPDIACLTFDAPGSSANILSRSVLGELETHLDALEARTDLAGLVLISGKPGMFIAGADLREFAESIGTVTPADVQKLCARGQSLFARLSKLPCVSVVAIDGICVGGGAEMSIWCDRRILSSGKRTEFGFPEVKLGLFPGWGGTARTPRIVGLSNAVEMITSGESVKADAALAMSLADDRVEAEELLPAAIRMIRQEQESGDYLRDREKWSQPLDICDMELGFLGATANAVIKGQTKGHYPAPEGALEVMLGSAGVDVTTACAMEAEGMSQLFGSPINAALLNVFFLTDLNKKDTGVTGAKIEPTKITSASVIGAGIMGAGITAANVKRNISTTLTDANAEALSAGVRTVMEEVSFNRQTKGRDVDRAIDLAPLVNESVSPDEIASSDLIIEAVVERLDVKQKIYAGLEPLMNAGAILASNTSSIPISKLAEGLARPDKFCGIHFFNPVRKMKLVEVIRGTETSDETTVTAVAYAKRLGKFPIVVADGPGFLVNRLLFPYMNEALKLFEEGVSIRSIEKAAKSFGMPMGPIALYDMVGIDTALYAGKVMHSAFPDRIGSSELLPKLVESGRLGCKSGKGFYSYENRKRKAQDDPSLADLFEGLVGPPKKLAPEVMTQRLFMPMLLEATRVLADGIVRDARDVDLGLIFGIGFPPFRGGLMHWADTLGCLQIVETCKALAEDNPHLAPTDCLQQMAKSGSTFYQR